MFFQLRKAPSRPSALTSRATATSSGISSTSSLLSSSSSFLRRPKDGYFSQGHVHLGSDDVEFLKSVFHSCVQSDHNHVILREFVQAVSKAPNMSFIIGNEKSMKVKHEMTKLDGIDAHTKMVSWPILEGLMQKNTNIRFPIGPTTISAAAPARAGLGGAGNRSSAPQPPSHKQYFTMLTQIGIEFGNRRRKGSKQSQSTHVAPDNGLSSSLSSSNSRWDINSPHFSRGTASLFPPNNGTIPLSPTGAAGQAAFLTSMFDARKDFLEEQQKIHRPQPDDSVIDRIDKLMQEKEGSASPSSSLYSDEEESEESDDGEPRLTERQRQLVGYRFNPLSAEDAKRVTEILQGPNTMEVLIEKFNIDINRKKILCMLPETWLNDEVINFYMEMLKDRDRALCAINPNRRPSHFFNSFFITKLLISDGKYNYSAVSRWTKRAKVDIFECDKVFCPVNIGNAHWTLLVAYMQRQEIHYYDSMSGGGSKYMNGFLKYLQDEHQNKKGVPFDTAGWRLVDREDYVPQQNNGTDCGVFSIVCADFVSDDLPMVYTQAHINLMRRKIVAAILRGDIDYPVD